METLNPSTSDLHAPQRRWAARDSVATLLARRRPAARAEARRRRAMKRIPAFVVVEAC
ncbi:MAG TPA: hypothetical protein VI670_19505 [Thermoanaerobaculia bacterium]|jgi:hypothetical protein